MIKQINSHDLWGKLQDLLIKFLGVALLVFYVPQFFGGIILQMPTRLADFDSCFVALLIVHAAIHKQAHWTLSES